MTVIIAVRAYTRQLVMTITLTALASITRERCQKMSREMTNSEAISNLKHIISNCNENCWYTGNYTDECDCEFCSHKHECSGYEGDNEGEEE